MMDSLCLAFEVCYLDAIALFDLETSLLSAISIQFAPKQCSIPSNMTMANIETEHLQSVLLSCNGQLYGLHGNSHNLASSISAAVKCSWVLDYWCIKHKNTDPSCLFCLILSK